MITFSFLAGICFNTDIAPIPYTSVLNPHVSLKAFNLGIWFIAVWTTDRHNEKWRRVCLLLTLNTVGTKNDAAVWVEQRNDAYVTNRACVIVFAMNKEVPSVYYLAYVTEQRHQ